MSEKVLNLFTRVVGNIETTDSQSGYRAYSRRAIEKIKITNPDMGAGSEILTQSKNPGRHGFGVLGSGFKGEINGPERTH